MGTEIEAYIERLDALREALRAAIHGTDAEELNWAPLDAETNSPCVLATHLEGSERFWIHHVLGGIEIQRDRDSEFVAVAPSSDELEGALVATGERSRTVLRRVSEAELGRERVALPDEPPVDGRYAVLHTLEHLGQHLGPSQPHKAALQATQRRAGPQVIRGRRPRRLAAPAQSNTGLVRPHG
jgi:uncharacterized damage-inducible protein DinB